MTVLRTFVFLALALASAFASAGPLSDFDGQPRALEDYLGRGKWLVVMFWASDCRVCNSEAYQYVDFHDLHHDRDAQVLGISMDGTAGLAAARAFVQRHGVTFPNLIGDPEAVARLYHRYTGEPFRGTPSFLVFDPRGELQARQVGAVPRTVIEEFIEAHALPAQASVARP